MNYDETLEILSKVRNWCEKGYQIALTPKELEALDYAMMAVKTCQDLPVVIAKAINEKGEEYDTVLFTERYPNSHQ